MRSIVVFLAALGFAGIAAAHAHLQSSTPANHGVLAVAPTEVTLNFQEAVQLTALSIQAGNAKPQKLRSLPSDISKTFKLPLPSLGTGAFVIAWRAVSEDRHVMSSTISFTVQPAVKK